LLLAEVDKIVVGTQYVLGAIFRDIHIWSATGDTGSGSSSSSYKSLTTGNAGPPGQALATLATPVGVVADFYVVPGDQVSLVFSSGV